MKDIYKNPMLYYLLAPVLVALWPLLVWAVYLPQAKENWDNEQSDYIDGQTYILDILRMDPDRLSLVPTDEVAGEFEYAKAIDRVANLCRIPASKCDYSAGDIITSGNKRKQQARVKLTDVDIVQAATFLSRIQSTWVKLTCDKVSLTKDKNLPDQWDVDFTFWYFY